MSFFTEIKRRLPAAKPAAPIAPPGLYHYRRELPGEQARIHLRVDPDGRGILMVNASRVYHLNPSGTAMAYLQLEQVPAEQAVRRLSQAYAAPARQLSDDYAQYAHTLDALLHPDEVCAVCDLDLDTTLPFTARPTAPYRMDLALTYRCQNDCAHCYNGRPRSTPELTTDQWLAVIDRTWQLSIPHIVFTGGEPTLRSDLPDLIRRAESSGQIAGLNTNGRRLADPAFLARLVDAGLDHVQITLESHDPAVHDAMVGRPGAWQQTVQGIRNALSSRLFVMTNTTLLQPNAAGLSETLDFLASLGVPTVGLNALIYSGRGQTVGSGIPEEELPALLDIARAKTDAAGQRLIWYTPTEYCRFDPVQMELGVKGCTAALYNMCVEPDGAVIPCQSYYQSVGSLLDDTWESIWNHPLCLTLRERRDLPGRCLACAFLAECGGGCPLSRSN